MKVFESKSEDLRSLFAASSLGNFGLITWVHTQDIHTRHERDRFNLNLGTLMEVNKPKKMTIIQRIERDLFIM